MKMNHQACSEEGHLNSQNGPRLCPEGQSQLGAAEPTQGKPAKSRLVILVCLTAFARINACADALVDVEAPGDLEHVRIHVRR